MALPYCAKVVQFFILKVNDDFIFRQVTGRHLFQFACVCVCVRLCMYVCICVEVCLYASLLLISSDSQRTLFRLPAAYHRYNVWRFVFVVLTVFALSLNN